MRAALRQQASLLFPECSAATKVPRSCQPAVLPRPPALTSRVQGFRGLKVKVSAEEGDKVGGHGHLGQREVQTALG